MHAPAVSTGRIMTNRQKTNPRTIPKLQPMPRRDHPATDEEILPGIELWMIAMVIGVVPAMSFGQASM